MKIVMDSSVLDLYERMLNPSDRQKKPGANLRYSADDKIAFDIIDALEKIHESGAIFCKLPINKEALKNCPKADKYLAKCCTKNLDIQKINQRMNELNDPHEDFGKKCRLLAEAEECGVNIILTRNGSFIDELARKSNSIKIIKPTDYFKK